MAGLLDTSIEFLKGVGPSRAGLLKDELNIATYRDLLEHYPFRHEDRTKFYKISEINPDMPAIQLVGQIVSYEMVGKKYKQRLVAYLEDETGRLQLVWFRGASWMIKRLQVGPTYVVFGKPTLYGRKLNIAHPEIEIATVAHEQESFLRPVYNTTEKLKRHYLDSKMLAKLMRALLVKVKPVLKEFLPQNLIAELKLMSKPQAVKQIHFPDNYQRLKLARFRLTFQELFMVQLQLLMLKVDRGKKFKGQVFNKAQLLTEFYDKYLPFNLTQAQKRVVKEIYRDLKSGVQMNRLLQGDVGSGKTIVAFITMLIAIDGDAQAAMMAPTEILAMQHYQGINRYAGKVGLSTALLTGSTKPAERRKILDDLETGSLDIVLGTHALLEQRVQFNNLGIAIVDEQHRFGVAQRSKLWSKNQEIYPHILVMTATPIPRTLAMTLYGDLDISVIDELPSGRKPIKTVHRYDSNRLKINGFIKKQLNDGRQVYIVYPLIEESEKSDLKDLMDGYESACRSFPDFPISIVHGKMNADAKSYEMDRFVRGETRLMVSTTVIEVGVDVPNATVMVIENAERFGLAQLHQLRGRVGRGADQSYCILISSFKLTVDARTRLETMVRTNNGFEIADVDLKLRGPGDLMGTQQSGILDLKIADLGRDVYILQLAREKANDILNTDPGLDLPQHEGIKKELSRLRNSQVNWSKIS